jgi:hypothetical protein
VRCFHHNLVAVASQRHQRCRAPAPESLSTLIPPPPRIVTQIFYYQTYLWIIARTRPKTRSKAHDQAVFSPVG